MHAMLACVVSDDADTFATSHCGTLTVFLHSWLQGFDNSGGWGNTSGVARGQGDWVASLEPNQKAGSILIRDLQGHFPAGTYTLMWDGDGIVNTGAFDVQEIRCVCVCRLRRCMASCRH